MQPPTRQASTLVKRHKSYSALQPLWNKISLLREGQGAIERNIEDFLPRRLEETIEQYRERTKYLYYTPWMSTYLAKYANKVSSSPHLMVTLEEAAWENFNKELNLDEFAAKLLLSLLLYGRVYISFEMEAGEGASNILDQQQLATVPKMFEALSVKNWGDDFVVVELISKPSTMEADSDRLLATWKVFDNDCVATYTAEVKPNNGSYLFWNGRSWVRPDNFTVSRTNLLTHQLGRPLLVKEELPDTLWLGKMVAPKQCQHLLIETQWTSSGVVSGIVQRVFTPAASGGDVRRIPHIPEPLKTDNEHVLIGERFQFVESTGQAIASLSSQLEKIESQIRDLCSHGYLGYMSARETAEAKAYNLDEVKAALKKYGSILRKLLQKMYDLVAELTARPRLQLLGYQDYVVDDLGSSLDHTTKIEELPTPRLPPTVLRLHYEKIAQQLLGPLSDDVKERIKEEFGRMYDQPEVET